MGKLKMLLAAAAGAGAAYLLDPEKGRTRRARLSDQMAAGARDGMTKTRRQADYQAGVVEGAIHDAVDRVRPEKTSDDATLLQKVRSEALGPSGVPSESLTIIVDDGVVTLRGTAPADGSVTRLVELASEVEGVEEVRNELSAPT